MVIDLVNHKQWAEEEIPLMEISESIQIIPLETSDSVLVGRISRIILEANKLYIYASNGIFVFDENGKFLNTISSKGRGPKEYVSLSELFPENDVVWLIDASGRKVLEFTDSGTFLQEFSLEKQRFMHFFHINGGNFIGFVPDDGFTNTNIMLAFFNSSGIVDSVLYRNPIPESSVMVSVYGEVTFINSSGQVKFKHVFNDTIYRILNNKLYPDFVLDLGSRKANENARAEAVNQSPETIDLYKGMDRAFLYGENERYIFLEVENIPFFYDKQTLKVHKWKVILPDDERIDPDQVQKFTPIGIDKNGNLIGEAAPANAEDNMVVIFAKLKK